MGEDRRPPPALEARALLAQAAAGGPGAALAARRAAALAEKEQPALAREALELATRLEPENSRLKLALARLEAEAGDLDAARTQAEQVLSQGGEQSTRARAAFILGEISRVRGDKAAARNHYTNVMRIEDALLSGNLNDPTAARWYARARGRVAELDAGEGQFDRARTGAEGALALLRATAAQIGEPPVLAADIADAEMRLAGLELDANQPGSARRRLAEAIGRYEALAITEKNEPHWRAVLSDAWALAAEADYVRGAAPDARAAMDKALQSRVKLATQYPEEAWALAAIWRTRAALFAALDDNAGAMQSLQQARHIAAQIVGADEESNRFFVHTLLDQADHALRVGAFEEAREAGDEARKRAEAFAQHPQAHPSWLGEAGACWDRLGEAARLSNAHASAHDAFARAAEFRRLACEREPANQRFLRGLAAALLKLGDAASIAQQPQSARAAFTESVRIRLDLADAAPTDRRAALALAAALERLGLCAQAAGDEHAARAAWEDELALADRLFAEDDLEGFRFCAIVEAHLARVGGPDADMHRASALARFDELAKAGMMTDAEAALRKSLWSPNQP